MIETNKKGNLGTVEIAPSVIEVIASIAVSEVKGVSLVQKNKSLDKLGVKNQKGVNVDVKDEEIYIDAYCAFDYGTKISKTATLVQQSIKNALGNMTAISPKQINIHIVSVKFKEN
ncbi:Asp23/Gls24 family envelope stress response protein [Macrococcus equi]|uniref:Asp23/Gls24 family envelope stress response protein n=1 Tax=Macrococcus equi TaxID=3395462 RepID=UPI0039BE5AB5